MHFVLTGMSNMGGKLYISKSSTSSSSSSSGSSSMSSTSSCDSKSPSLWAAIDPTVFSVGLLWGKGCNILPAVLGVFCSELLYCWGNKRGQ